MGTTPTCLAQQRPRFDMTDADVARMSQHRSGVALSKCINLSPAGTGTTSLWHALRAVREESEKPPQTTIPLIHSHQLRAENVNASCFVVTVRDPSQRLVTGFAWEQAFASTPAGRALIPASRLVTKPTPSPEEWVRAAQSGTPNVVMLYNRSSTPDLQRWESRTDAIGGHRLLNGNIFLVPAASYVSGVLGVTAVEVHFLCTNRLEHDWQALVSRFDASGDLGMPLEKADTLMRKMNSKRRSEPHVAIPGARSAARNLSESAAAYVRTCLFPEDWLLAGAAGCGWS